MADQQVKVTISTDATGAVEGFRRFRDEADKTDKHAANIGASIKKNWLAVSAATAAVGVAAHQAMQYMEQAAKAQQAAEAYYRVGESAGYSTKKMDDFTNAMKKAAAGTVDDSDIMQKAVSGMVKGLGPDQIVKIMETARYSARFTGEDVKTAYENITDAISTNLPKALKRYGLVTKEEMAVVDAAIKEGAENVNLYKLAMMNADIQAAKMGPLAMTNAEMFQKFSAQVSETKEQLGAMGLTIINGLFPAMSSLNVEFEKDAGAKWGKKLLLATIPVQAEIYRLAMLLDKLGGTATSAQMLLYGPGRALGVESSTKRFEAAAEANMEYQRRYEESDKALEALALKEIALQDELAKKVVKTSSVVDSSIKEKIQHLENSKNAYLDNIKAMTAGMKNFEKQAKETARSLQHAYNEAIRGMSDEIDAGVRITIEAMREKEDFDKFMRGENQFTFDPYQDAVNQIKNMEEDKYQYIDKLRQRDFISAEQAEKAKLKVTENTTKRLEKLHQDLLKDQQDLYKNQLSDLSSGFGSLASAFQDIASVYGEGSDSAQKWLEAAKAMEIAQRAVAVVNAVAAISASAAAPWPAGFVSMAAMAGAMASLLSSIGISINGGGSASAEAQTPAMGNSTVLGAAYGTASESIAKSFELLQDTYDLEDTKLTKIYNELRDLNTNITGLVSGIIRTGGKFDAMTFESDSFAATRAREVFMGGDVMRTIAKWSGDTLGMKNLEIWADPISYVVNNLLGDLVQSVVTGIFGGEKTIGTIGAGYKISGTSINDIMSGGVLAQQYQTIMSKTSGGWFGSDKVAIGTIYSAVDSEVAGLFNKVFKNLGGTLVGLAELLGTDVNDALAYKFKDIKLNLMGKDGDEISEAISAALSAAGDTAAKSLFGEIVSRYQRVNEGLLETATRLVTDKESVMNILQLTNQAFDGTTSELLSFSEALIDVAGGLEDLTEAFETYYDAFFSDAEKQADLKKQLSAALGMYGYSLPGTRTGYRALVEGVNMADDAGKAAYAALMMLAESSDQYYQYIEDARGKINESDYATRVEYERAVRGYAGGGYHSGGYRIVGEYGPELERTGPSTIYSTSDSRKALGTDDILGELRMIRQETGEAIFVIARDIQQLKKLHSQWDTEGLPSDRDY